MSWTMKRHFAAKKVLAKHQDDLDKQQAHIDNFRKEAVKDLQKELKNVAITRGRDAHLRRSVLFEKELVNGEVLPVAAVSERIVRNVNRKYAQHSARRQSEPVAASKDQNKASQLIDSKASLEFLQFLQNANLGVITEPHQTDVHNGRIQVEHKPDSDVNILNLESESESKTESVVLNSKVEYLNLDQPIPTYAMHKRRMSLPVNSMSVPKALIDTNLKVEPVSASQSSRLKSRRGSLNVDQASGMKYLNHRRGSWNSDLLTKSMDIRFVEENADDLVPKGKYAVPNTYRSSADDIVPTSRRVDKPNVTLEDKKMWDDVARCRYIRGYDPPEMKMPSCETNVYVFGRNLSESIEARLSDKPDELDTPRPFRKH